MHQLFIKLIIEASEKYEKPVPHHADYRNWIEEAGFVDVKEYNFKIPINSWPKNKQLKEVGKYQVLNYTEGYEGIGIGLFTRTLGWQPTEFQVLLARMRNKLKAHLFLKIGKSQDIILRSLRYTFSDIRKQLGVFGDLFYCSTPEAYLP